MAHVVELNDTNFDKMVNAEDKPFLAVFHAPWCGHCRTQEPIIEELSNEMGNKISIGKMNIEENQRKALEYSITGVPAFLIFKDGKVVDHRAGAHRLIDLKLLIEKYL